MADLVPISKLKPNPTNPRVLHDERFAKLKRSIQDFPDMLNYRGIVAVTDTDGKFMVLGGNMRLRALQELGIKEVPVMLADHWTEEQRREFIIKDNVGFGEWSWEDLANEWDAGELAEWGLELPKGVAVVLQAEHLCMAMRGVCKRNTVTKTSKMLGAFKDDHKARAEFLGLITK